VQSRTVNVDVGRRFCSAWICARKYQVGYSKSDMKTEREREREAVARFG
jgi:hypothetical protein